MIKDLIVRHRLVISPTLIKQIRKNGMYDVELSVFRLIALQSILSVSI